MSGVGWGSIDRRRRVNRGWHVSAGRAVGGSAVIYRSSDGARTVGDGERGGLGDGVSNRVIGKSGRVRAVSGQAGDNRGGVDWSRGGSDGRRGVDWWGGRSASRVDWWWGSAVGVNRGSAVVAWSTSRNSGHEGGGSSSVLHFEGFFFFGGGRGFVN